MKTAKSGVPSPEDRILKAYADKLDQSYFSGYNRIDLTVRRGTAAAMRSCLAGMAAAFIFYALLSAVISADTEKMILQDIISPLEKLFINAVIMVGTPITFVSFIKNMTDTYIISERDSTIQALPTSRALS